VINLKKRERKEENACEDKGVDQLVNLIFARLRKRTKRDQLVNARGK
jgi:hypothetical protein